MRAFARRRGDVDEITVGRIFKTMAAHPEGRPWMWMIVFHKRRGQGRDEGHVATRNEAMEAFRAAWDAGIGKNVVACSGMEPVT
jgi:hypothetical protein